MSKWLKKRDIILIAVLLLVGIITLIIWAFIYSDKGKSVTIEQRGEIIGTYSLDKDETINIEYKGKTVNKIIIEDGYCYMQEAECPDHLCIKQGKINKKGQTIVCMPNRVVVSVTDDDESGYDSIAS
ncbi:MAG: NusG domain II-containing protein [Lachnospiraceae bacterium]|nr:NusG domain II-containing protein [Lachnospiraceae bacterium]